MNVFFWIAAAAISAVALFIGLRPLGYRGAKTPAALCLAVSIVLYLFLGSPERMAEETRSLAEIADDLQDHLNRNPEDESVWQYLAHLRMELNQFPESAAAYEILIDRRGAQPDLLLRWADALAMAAGGSMAGQPEQLVQRALTMNPDSRNGLWMAGMAAMARGDREEALSYWQRLLPQLPEEPPELRALLQRMMKEAGVSGAPAMPQAVPGAVVALVQIPFERMAGLPADAPVFVIVRTDDEVSAPLAVVRRIVSDLPFTVVLDDQAVMRPGAVIADHSILRVHARVALHGGALAAPGDLISARHIVSPGDVVVLDLSRAVPAAGGGEPSPQ